MPPTFPPPAPGTLRLALALDETGALTPHHFGQAATYRVVDVTGPGDAGATVADLPAAGGSHDHGHGEGGKAQAVIRRMRQGGVQVLVGRAFGGNIHRVKRMFVPVLVRAAEPAQAIAAVAARLDDVQRAWEAGEEREHLVIR